MFPRRYFPGRMFAPRYWPVGGDAVIVPGPYSWDAGQVYTPGTQAAQAYRPGNGPGQVYRAGTQAGQSYKPGTQAGEVIQ